VKIPTAFLIHPVGVGSTRQMNVESAEMWLRVLVDLLPDVVIAAPWLPYARAHVDRDRGIRDALVMIDPCDAIVAVGGEFSRGMREEWLHGQQRKLTLIDLTQPPLPAILTLESFAEARSHGFQQRVTDAFRVIAPKAAA